MNFVFYINSCLSPNLKVVQALSIYKEMKGLEKEEILVDYQTNLTHITTGEISNIGYYPYSAG